MFLRNEIKSCLGIMIYPKLKKDTFNTTLLNIYIYKNNFVPIILTL